MPFRDVESVHCSEVDGNVIVRGLYGELEPTALGSFASRESVELAPEDCPLVTWAGAHHRFVGLFNTCLECPNADVNRRELPPSQNAN